MMTEEQEGFYNSNLQQYNCRLCPMSFNKEEVVAWEIHKLNHTLVALKNVLIKVISK